MGPDVEVLHFSADHKVSGPLFHRRARVCARARVRARSIRAETGCSHTHERLRQVGRPEPEGAANVTSKAFFFISGLIGPVLPTQRF